MQEQSPEVLQNRLQMTSWELLQESLRQLGQLSAQLSTELQRMNSLLAEFITLVEESEEA